MNRVSGINWYESIDSTNNEARRIMDMCDNMTVISTKCQTAGRGQGTHTWFSSDRTNLLFTVVFKPSGPAAIKASEALYITCITTLSLLSYLEKHGIKARIKWPNDIWVEDKKICGILIENTLKGEYVDTSIIGIGLNVNEPEFPSELPNPVSMFQLTGEKLDLETELVEFRNELCRHALMLENESGRAYLQEEFEKNMFRLTEEL